MICNPLLFGVQADGRSPFCVEKSAQATLACDSASSADDGAVTPLDQEHAGLKEVWNNFADRLFKMCHQNKIAAALHCAECEIATKRLFALNVLARDVESCGAALKFEEAQCDANGVCHGTPSGGARSGARRTRAVSSSETKRVGARGDREISSVQDKKETDSKAGAYDTKPIK